MVLWLSLVLGVVVCLVFSCCGLFGVRLWLYWGCGSKWRLTDILRDRDRCPKWSSEVLLSR